MKAFLRLTIEGATEDETMRGLHAAMAVFEKAGINPYDAAGGVQARERWDAAGFPENDEIFSEQDGREAAVWDDAVEAAFKACCADWPADRPREGDGLEVFLDEEAKAFFYGDDDEDDDDDLVFTPEQQAAFEEWLKAGKPMN